jgi:hypothetical protein
MQESQAVYRSLSSCKHARKRKGAATHIAGIAAAVRLGSGGGQRAEDDDHGVPHRWRRALGLAAKVGDGDRARSSARWSLCVVRIERIPEVVRPLWE